MITEVFISVMLYQNYSNSFSLNAFMHVTYFNVKLYSYFHCLTMDIVDIWPDTRLGL